MIAELVERLAVRFPQIPRGQVDEVVTAAFADLEHARLRNFVPVLVENAALGQLRRIALTADPIRQDTA